MREILFRGQTRRKGEKVRMDGFPVGSNWVYGGIFQGPINSVIYGYDPVVKYAVYSDTVGQYTGLKDKNGQRIFEGDILLERRFCFGDIYYIIEWGESSFGAKLHRNGKTSDIVTPIDDCEYGFSTDNLEIIGNIYDNPELIKED